MGSGAKGGGGTGAHDYYGTICAVLCAGPVDAVLGIIADGKTVWPEASGEWADGSGYDDGTVVHRGGRAWTCTLTHTASPANAPGEAGAPWEEYALRREDPGVGSPATITVPGYGFAVLYWGTDDQSHGADTPAEIADNHPPYRRQCWVILKDWLFGRERTSAPNVEVLVRRAPTQDIITGLSADLDNDGQCNPVAFAAELISDDVFGAGAGDLADPESWQSAADALQEEPEKWSLSPVVREANPFSVLAESLAGYAPLYQRTDGDGQVALGVFPRLEAPPDLGSNRTVDKFALAEPIIYEVSGAPVSEVSIRYRDRGRAFKDRNQKATDTLSRGMLSADPVSLDRPWITRPAQAAFAAADHLRRNYEPPASGRAICIRERVPWMQPGSIFLLVDESAGVRTICRCLSVSDEAPPSSRRTVTWEAETGFAPMPVLTEASGANPVNPSDPETVTLYRFVQPPAALAGGDAAGLMLLAARTDPTTTSLRLWMQQADPTLFAELGLQASFAITGTLQTGYLSSVGASSKPPDDNSEALRVTLDPATVAADTALLSETQSADAINDARVLVWVFKSDGQFEVMTLRAARIAPGESFWRLKVRRARYGTTRLGFSSGDRVFLTRRSGLVPYSHRLFAAYAVNGTPAVFRIQAGNPWKAADLTDPAACPDRSFTFGDEFAPSSTWTRIEAYPPGGPWADVSSFAGTFLPGTQFRLSATLSDPNGDLGGATIRTIGPQDSEGTVWNGAAVGSSNNIQTTFTLSEGDWGVVLRVWDRGGRRREFALTLVGSSTPVTVLVHAASPTAVWNPVASPRGGDVFAAPTVTLTCSTVGASIEYQVVSLGASVGGSWTSYSAPVSVPVDSTLYARAKKAGLTDSPVIRHDYAYLDPETVG